MRYGVNGNPLRERKLDLPELLEKPTVISRARVDAAEPWKEA
jgi:hypothetical protein